MAAVPPFIVTSDRVAQAALDRALEENEDLVVLYQPIHHARTGAIYGAEALLRQRRQSGELREASIIHETAEENRGAELFELDHILVRKAYADAARWQAFAPDVRVNVNLSPREFQDGRVLERLTSLVDAYGIDTTRVNLEITETAQIPAATEPVLRALKENLGVGIWLDDFGTGHSAVEHLLHFSVDGIKLPGTFVQPLPTNERCRAITRHLIALAHDLGLSVIAEEVERQDQLDFLLEQNCEYIQGFLFSRPMMPEAFEQFLRDSRYRAGAPDRG
ncbi:MAG TPA: EAL domain-containing protein [Thermoanaerobaculia bacterium]|nr:EAL domain-containing protein [Thermoanaerobaculia bacterium]